MSIICVDEQFKPDVKQYDVQLHAQLVGIQHFMRDAPKAVRMGAMFGVITGFTRAFLNTFGNTALANKTGIAWLSQATGLMAQLQDWTDEERQQLQAKLGELMEIVPKGSLVLHTKNYSSEELSDLMRDVRECFDPLFQPLNDQIPQDEHGFDKGTYAVSVIWSPENDQ